MLLGSLERQRRIFEWKCAGVEGAGMRATVGASTMTLGGLVKHLAAVEDEYFTRRIAGRALPSPWDGVDWTADPDWEWHSASEDSPEELLSLWREAVARSRAVVADALSEGGVDRLARFTTAGGASPSIRRLLFDMVEEYSRHVGHADLLREAVDGVTGEDPPG